MSTSPETLPWTALRLSDPPVPWEDLRTLAESAAASAEVRARLKAMYHDALDRRYSEGESAWTDLTDLAVPAVFAMAAERLDAEGRRDAAEFLIRALFDAGEADDDILLEVIEQAAGALGPAVLEPAVELLREFGSNMECWFHLMSLLPLAKEAEPPLRDAIVSVCRGLVDQMQDEIETYPPVATPAHVLAELGDKESLPLLKTIYAHSGSLDLKESIDQLEGIPSFYDHEATEPWEEPVEEWLPRHVEEVRSYLEEDDEYEVGDDEVDPEEAYAGAMEHVERFLSSSAYDELPRWCLRHADFVTDMFAHHLALSVGSALETVTADAVEEVLLKWFPLKVGAERETFMAAPRIIAAFLRWLQETGVVEDAEVLAEKVTDCGPELLRRSQDPGYWGMAKTITMLASEHGIDPGDAAAVKAFWNSRAAGPAPFGPELAPADEEADDEYPPLAPPIHREARKVGRNDPCPCGSGKKYKKCCGR